jgi:putative acetyltransferase
VLLVHPEHPENYDAIDAVVTEAFGRELEARLVRLLREDPDAYIPDLALVAVREGEVIAHIMLTNATLHGDEVRRALALGPLAVRPSRQRSGVGTALMEAALARAEERGDALVVLLGHPTYYPRFGFEPASRLGIEPPSPDLRGDAFMAKRLTNFNPAYRGTFRFPPAFDAVS